MIRPCFERSQVSDVLAMEKHVLRLVKLIPKDCSTIDLAPLFHQLTLDIATEFLFGRSTNVLDTTQIDNAGAEFMRAFNYCQDPLGSKMYKRLGFIGLFLPDPTFKKHARSLRGASTLKLLRRAFVLRSCDAFEHLLVSTNFVLASTLSISQHLLVQKPSVYLSLMYRIVL
jgi:hypothetical protein